PPKKTETSRCERKRHSAPPRRDIRRPADDPIAACRRRSAPREGAKTPVGDGRRVAAAPSLRGFGRDSPSGAQLRDAPHHLLSLRIARLVRAAQNVDLFLRLILGDRESIFRLVRQQRPPLLPPLRSEPKDDVATEGPGAERCRSQ